MIFGSTLSITSYPSGIFEHKKLEWITFQDARKKSIKMGGSKVSTAFENILILKKIVKITLKKGVIKRSSKAFLRLFDY